MDSEDEAKLMSCDCCGQMKEGVTFLIVYGLDTFACPECRGLE